MDKYKLYGARTPEESEREREHRILARKTAAEGMVLLKNEGVLPFKNKKLALYGAGARMTVRGGTGSGDTHERYSVSIEQGLLNAGYELPNTKWMNHFDADYDHDEHVWRDGIEEKIKDYTMENVLEMFEVIYAIPLRFPIGEKILPEELDNETDTAIYVVARQAGEGADRKVEEGDFLLTEVEKYNIKLLSEQYANFLLVINCGGIIDLSCLDEMPGIGAVLFFGQGGTEGGNAFADLVSGKVTPSGKLADTWGNNYLDYPSADNYSYRNGNLNDEDYKEGIYVGYRYFDSFDIAPMYEFGYGLSYTTFEWNCLSTKVNGSTVSSEVEVQNTGAVYSGKEVIQLYIEKPLGKLDHERKTLAAFAKTSELKPGEKEVVTLTFDMRELASYEQKHAEWLLEKGEYGVYVGNSSRNLSLGSVLELNEEVITEKDTTVCKTNLDFEDIKSISEVKVYDATIPRVFVDGSAISCLMPKYEKPERKHSIKIDQAIDGATVEELASLCVGGGQFGETYHRTPGAVGWTSMALLDRGVPNINFGDGPAGLNLTIATVVEADGTSKYLGEMPKSQNWGFIRKMGDYALGDPNKGTPIYQYMTAWPATHVQAQTWNPELLYQIGEAVGKEMMETGVTLWLAPALNIHRNPLCGRNFEYYSEDPYLSGKMAASITKGVQSHPGIGVTMKHFCCNNQESNRNYVSENVSERAMRELYIRGFRYVIEEAKPMAVMSSYNKVNSIYTANSYDLLTKVLRNEWGYQGLVMSDWHSTGGDKASYEGCITAGNDLIMPGNPTIVPALIKAVEEKKLSIEELKWCAANVLDTVFKSAFGEM